MGNLDRRVGVAWRRAIAWCALAILFLGSLAIVIYAASGRSALVSNSTTWTVFPGWLAGPFHGLIGRPSASKTTVDEGFSAVLVVMIAAYLVALWAGRSLSGRAIGLFAGAMAVLLLLSPPLQLTDIFNYLAYARLGAVHGLNPYTHTINAELRDPTYQLSTWHNWHSPYGTLFTALTYPVALLPLPVAFWTMKALTVLFSLTFLWLIARCARLLGRDPRLPVLIVAANPVYLIYAVAEFHNDFFMLVPAMAAIAWLLSGHYRRAGGALAAAVAVKLTMILLLPFLLLAAWRRHATLRVITGAILGAVALGALSLMLFGPVLPNVSGQSRLLTGWSVPNLLGWAIGLDGGTPQLVRDMNVLIVLVVGYQLLRRRDWLTGAGWATLALLASLGWLMPWYVVWLLPLAVLADSVTLRRVAVIASVFVAVTFLPVVGILEQKLEFNPTSGPVGVAAYKYDWLAQHWRPHVVPPWVAHEDELRLLRRCGHRAGWQCPRLLHEHSV